jgi:hypothetical protein
MFFSFQEKRPLWAAFVVIGLSAFLQQKQQVSDRFAIKRVCKSALPF